MARSRALVAENRGYAVCTVTTARQICSGWVERAGLRKALGLGLPEIDDRYHVWRVPLVSSADGERVGEVVIDAYTSLVDEARTTAVEAVEARLLKRAPAGRARRRAGRARVARTSSLRNTIALGDSEQVLKDLPAESAHLVFTSPPYYNARPEYADYLSYEEYLLKLRRVIHGAHRVLAEGRFFVMNVCPVLVRRASRSLASRRIAVPFDVHQLFILEGYDFVDDIIWQKPEGAGWATGRGRRFAADRNPLQYKPVPVTEYVLVYRKHTERLIDWNIRSHPEKSLVRASRIPDGYERTNVWKIKPAHDRRHPAVFPLELAEKVISYYSFKGDVVMDPFAGIGTVGKAACLLERQFVLIERDPEYVAVMQAEAKSWLGKRAEQVLTIGCPAIEAEDTVPLGAFIGLT